MNWNVWLLFLVTEAVLSMAPGPAVLYVLSQSLQNGPGKSVWASGGILSANAMYFVLSATSLGAVLVTSYKVFFLIKWVGAAYLIYLGVRSFFGKASVREIPNDVAVSSRTGFRILRGGFFLQASNPKALLFFTAILPQFIDPRRAVAYQILVLGMTSVAIELLILLLYGELAARAAARLRTPGFQKLTDRIGGSLLIGAGLGLARLRRS